MAECDYHDLPLVCGTCGEDIDPDVLLAPAANHHRLFDGYDDLHPLMVAHMREDPEGMELTQIIPCQLA